MSTLKTQASRVGHRHAENPGVWGWVKVGGWLTDSLRTKVGGGDGGTDGRHRHREARLQGTERQRTQKLKGYKEPQSPGGHRHREPRCPENTEPRCLEGHTHKTQASGRHRNKEPRNQAGTCWGQQAPGQAGGCQEQGHGPWTIHGPRWTDNRPTLQLHRQLPRQPLSWSGEEEKGNVHQPRPTQDVAKSLTQHDVGNCWSSMKGNSEGQHGVTGRAGVRGTMG